MTSTRGYLQLVALVPALAVMGCSSRKVLQIEPSLDSKFLPIAHVRTETRSQAGTIVSDNAIVTVLASADSPCPGFIVEGLPYYNRSVLADLNSSISKLADIDRRLVTRGSGIRRFRAYSEFYEEDRIPDNVLIAGFPISNEMVGGIEWWQSAPVLVSGHLMNESSASDIKSGNELLTYEVPNGNYEGFVGGPVLVVNREGCHEIFGLVIGTSAELSYSPRNANGSKRLVVFRITRTVANAE